MFYCVKEGCDGKTKVMETKGVYRRRKCLVCRSLCLTEETEYKVKKGELNPLTEQQ